MPVYKVTLADGQTFKMDADLVQASAPISANFHGDENSWQITPYQTADARHISWRAAELVAKYFADMDDCTEVESVEVEEDADDSD